MEHGSEGVRGGRVRKGWMVMKVRLRKLKFFHLIIFLFKGILVFIYQNKVLIEKEY